MRHVFLALALAATSNLASAADDRPVRGGTELNPYWVYSPNAILAANNGAGIIDGGSMNITKAATSGFLNGPVLKLCQPLFNGHGIAAAAAHLLVRLKPNPDSTDDPVLMVKIEAIDNGTGHPITNIANYAYGELTDNQWFPWDRSISIANGAHNVCMSIYTYPITVLSGGTANPYIDSLWISSAEIHENSSPQ